MNSARNRASLGSRLGLIVLAANTRMQRSNDAFYPFEQEANFWYLSGINEPDWRLVVEGSSGKSWLIAPDIDSAHETFDGSLAPDIAKQISGVDTVLTHDEGESLLRTLAKKHTVVHTVGDHPHKRYFNFVVNPAQHQLQSQLERMFHTVRDCRGELAKLRAIKQPDEIKAIQRAIKLTAAAFTSVKNNLDTYKYEYEIAAEFDYRFARANATHAYDPIVASGQHACTLHYVKNDSRLKPRTGVLMDIGARVDGYAADITRTYAKGEPTKRLREVHTAVEAAHHEIINLLVPELSVEAYQQRVDEIMENALVHLGLMQAGDETKFRRYFPHAISHGLGVDVHDSLGAPRHFLPGMVLTVEPGIYIPEEGIGVRIEDDILITDKGNTNLSKALPTAL